MPRLDHVNIHTRDAPAMLGFLKTMLGAEEGFRPPFDVPGHWLYLDGHPAIHLNIVEREKTFRPACSTTSPSPFMTGPRYWKR
ncbi:MAG: hypothetical protein PW735_10625 [Acidobacteriaceae bacterium]|nr:hypothetical protein [Acidobacteriaceae bacterium]